MTCKWLCWPTIRMQLLTGWSLCEPDQRHWRCLLASPRIYRMKGDWVRVFDETHECDYWTNSRTGKSQWTEPEDTAVGETASSSPDAPAAKGSDTSASTDTEQRGRSSSQLEVSNPMNNARAARTAKRAQAAEAPLAGDSKDTPSAVPAAADAKRNVAGGGRGKLNVSVASPLQDGFSKGGSGGLNKGSPTRSPTRASVSPASKTSNPVQRGASSGGSSSALSRSAGAGAGSGAASGSKQSGPLSEAQRRRLMLLKRPKYKYRRRKREKWRAQPCSELQQNMYTLTIFGSVFNTTQQIMRYILMAGIFLGFGVAMLETDKDRPALGLIITAEVVYVIIFTLEYMARLWSCHPLAFEEHDGTEDQRNAQHDATELKQGAYAVLYNAMWPLHTVGMLCNPDAASEARFRFAACCGSPRKARIAFKDKGYDDAWSEPLPYVLGCIPATSKVSAAGAFWQRVQFALRWPSVFDLLQIIPLFLHGIAPDQIALFAHTPDITYVGAAFRFIRVMRVVKFIRYIPTMGKLIEGISTVKQDLLTSTTAGLIVAMLLSAGAHAAEQHENAEFSSIPKALWCMLMTLTTVGYGDVSPTSQEGKMISSVAAIAGIGLFTIPAATIARGFQEHAAKLKERQEMAVDRLLGLYRAKKLRLAWKKWLKQSELAAMADRMADPNSRKAQLYYRRNLARELLRLCALELGTCLETVSKAVSEAQGMGAGALGFEVGGGVDDALPGSPRRGMGSPRRTSTMRF